jgi:Leucine-rich repeat (LRR) protein
MKALLVATASLFIALHSQAQIQILSEKQLNDRGLTIESLEKKCSEYQHQQKENTKSRSVFDVWDKIGNLKDSTIYLVEQAVQTQRPDTVKYINFNQLQLKSIPEVVYRFQNLESLDLSQNELTAFTLDLSQLPKLKSLNIAKNKLSDFQFIEPNAVIEKIDLSHNSLGRAGFNVAVLPKLTLLNLSYNDLKDSSLYFGEGQNLKVLNLQQNELNTIPEAIKTNRKLESLWLGGNNLTNLTDKSFAGLKHLKDLNLYKCGLTVVPRGIKKLKRLEVLDLYYNKLTALPKSIKRLKKMQQLAVAFNEIKELPLKLNRNKNIHTIYAHHNRISQLPDRITKLKNLKLLDINHNWFSVFPEIVTKMTILQELDLSYNNLTELSPNLQSMRQLQKIFITENPVSTDKKLLSNYKPMLGQMEKDSVVVYY